MFLLTVTDSAVVVKISYWDKEFHRFQK